MKIGKIITAVCLGLFILYTVPFITVIILQERLDSLTSERARNLEILYRTNGTDEESQRDAMVIDYQIVQCAVNLEKMQQYQKDWPMSIFCKNDDQ